MTTVADWDGFRSDPAGSAILTDFDGTLSEIVVDPASAVPLPGVVATLERLSAVTGVVAVVSGRPLDFLVRHFGSGVDLSGLYGLENRIGGRVVRSPEGERWRPVVDVVVDDARRELPRGVHVEHKGLAVTLHYRAAPETRATVEEWARRRAEDTGLRTAPARCSVELDPPVEVDKGTVVGRLLDGAVVHRACYLGDDIADLAAFDALTRWGGAVRRVAVRGAETPAALLGAADEIVPGPRAAAEVLASLTRPAGQATAAT